MTEGERLVMEQAYAFFHQKWKVYVKSPSEWEKDHIEESISSYVNSMSPWLYSLISEGEDSYLREHSSFTEDITDALSKMENMLF
mgnify:CR=1 FL=1